MTTPAVRILVDRLAAALASIPDRTTHKDRAEDEAFEPEELDVVNIRVPYVEPTLPNGQHAVLHIAQVFVDLVAANGETENAAQKNAAAESAVNAALMADFTLGGRLQDLKLVRQSTTEMEGADIGRSIIEFEAQFWTSYTDLNAIIGVGGVIYTD